MTIREKVAAVPQWRHRIRLPEGITTPGSQDTLGQLPTIGLPGTLAGATVLDVGCSDGFYSFECESRGAARVLAIDNYSSVYIDNPSGFNVAREALNSKVEFLRSDLFELDAARIGQFDVVLFLGVLYHLRHPMLALEKLATLCKRQLIMETATPLAPQGLKAWVLRRLGIPTDSAWMEFYPGDEINRDPTTWWAPTPACAEAMLTSCGFCDVKTVSVSGNRTVTHGFSPEQGTDAEALASSAGEEAVAAVGRDLFGIVTSGSAGWLRSLSIPDFGRVRQELAERRSKTTHHARKPPTL